MAKIIIEIEDLPEGTAVNFKGDLPAADARIKRARSKRLC